MRRQTNNRSILVSAPTGVLISNLLGQNRVLTNRGQKGKLKTLRGITEMAAMPSCLAVRELYRRVVATPGSGDQKSHNDLAEYLAPHGLNNRVALFFCPNSYSTQ